MVESKLYRYWDTGGGCPIAHRHTAEKNWLLDSASLTTRLRQFTNNKIRLARHYDNWGNAPTDYRRALGLSLTEKTWIRRIQWCYETEIWVSCLVVIPKTSITPHTQELIHIGNGSIGDVIFKDPTLTRSEFHFVEAENTVTRYSIFHYKNKPLLIVESFLPIFLEKLK